MFPPRGLHLNGSSLIINAERIELWGSTQFLHHFPQLITVNLHTPVAEKKVLGTLTSTQPNKSFM